MKTSSIYKTGNNPPAMNKIGNQLHPNEFIKGTSVSKDYQLTSEPLQPKVNNQMFNGTSSSGISGLMSISGYGQNA